jgi:betaine reductase
MGANAGEPHNVEMQTAIVTAALNFVEEADSPGQIKELPIEYHAKI